jgi:hypothetical protein
MSDLESMKSELRSIKADFKNYGERLTDYGHDLLLSRIEMLESMIAIEEKGW